MFSPKSPKSKKLMLFQEKLSRLSNKQEASVSHSKLEKLESQNQQFEREISDILDRIAQYYHMRQQRVSAECKQIVEALQRRESYLIDLLARYKQAQIEEVKECGDQFVIFQKSIRNRMRELESSSVSSDFLVQINNIKPFNLRKLHSKTEDMIFNRSTLQKQLDCFESLKSIITQHLNPRDNKLTDEAKVNKPISLNKTTNNQKGLGSRKMDNESRMNEIRKKANQFKENQHQLSYKNSKNDSNDEAQLENLLFQPKTQENLMDDESCKSPTQKLEPWKELKFLKSYEEEDQDIKVQKSVYNSVGRKQQKIDKEIPKQSSIQLKNSIQAVLQMKRSSTQTIINPINGRFSSDINSKRNLIMSIRPSSLTRVKSQEGFIFKSRANPDSIREHHDISSKQIENISAVGSVRASKVGVESKTARKGDWAQILKQQQTKYNEMRKKLKS